MSLYGHLSGADRFATEKNKRHAEKRDRNLEVINIVRDVCERHGGMSDIGGGYVVVDTRKHKVVSR